MLPFLAPSMLQAPPEPARPHPLAQAVTAAERAFAADAARRGTPAAFVAAFSEEGLVFTPRPENARAVYGVRKDDGSLLSWGPSCVEVAASGDFALSTGPWSWRAKGVTAPTAFGHCLSLWVLRQGRWQVLLDIGVSHPVQALEALTLVAHSPSASPGTVLEPAWAAFDRMAARDLAVALRASGAADLRLYRKGHAVLPGNLEFLAAAEAGAARWDPLGREVSASRDLAFRWGTRTRAGIQATALQVWRREGPGWRLAMDVALPESPAP